MATRPPLPPLLTDLRRAPRPVGPLTGRRTRLRRLIAHGCAAVNRALDLLPPGRWLHRYVQLGLRFTPLQLPVGAAHGGLHGLRLAFLSDVHAGSFMHEQDLLRICERLVEQQPDVVCLGGDLINTRDRELLLFRRPLQRLQPRLGICAVPGNHDHFHGRDIGRWSAFLRDQGVQVLTNAGVRLRHGGSSLWLCGVDDLTEGEPDLAAALAGRAAGEPAILLSHHPDFFFEAAANGVDLTLAGHTHGGQIRLWGWSPVRHSRFGYERGWFEAEGCRLYVGCGVGVTVLPLRLDAPPELPIVQVVCRAGAPATPLADDAVGNRPAPAQAADGRG